MTISLKHKFVSEVEDGDDDTVVRPSNWNDEHDLSLASGRILGRVSGGAGAVEELDAATVRTLINVEDGADVTDATNVAAAGAVMAASTFGADNLLLRADGSGRGAQASPIVVADTTGAISRVGGGGVPIEATDTNDNAGATQVGRILAATGSGITLTTATVANIASLELLPGDWDVRGTIQFVPSAATTTLRIGGISDTSGALPGSSLDQVDDPNSSTGTVRWPTIYSRRSLAVTTTVYLVARATFDSGSVEARGRLFARRAR